MLGVAKAPLPPTPPWHLPSALYVPFLIQLHMWKNEIVQKIQGKGSARTELIFTKLTLIY